jgi:hypothetical protein
MAVSVSPTTLRFSPTHVGPECPGANCTYAMVTVTNDGTATEYAVSAEPFTGSGPFWPTWGGTLNTPDGLPAGESRTLQFGFKPLAAGSATATGQISFQSGQTVSFQLEGRGTPGR